jgi:CBS domain-containing protein
MIVKDIMTRTPVMCLPSSTVQEVARMMLENDCGEVPVVRAKDAPELLGVITDRDICCRAIAVNRNPSTTQVTECMSSPVFTVNVDTDLSRALRVFQEKEVRRLPVVDKNNKCVGILSLSDVAEKAPEHFAREVLRASSKPSSSPGISAH